MSNLSTRKKLRPTIFASLATIYIYRHKSSENIHTKSSTTGFSRNIVATGTAVFSLPPLGFHSCPSCQELKNIDRIPPPFTKESNYPISHREWSENFGFNSLVSSSILGLVASSSLCLPNGSQIGGDWKGFEKMSRLRENLGNGRLSVFRWAAVVGPPAGWQLDESIPTNCFNYFFLSKPFSTPKPPPFYLGSVYIWWQLPRSTFSMFVHQCG